MARLNLSDVSVSAAGVCLLRGVSLEVCPGEWISIVGPNGAGKTSLLRVCAGVLPYSSGIVSVAGEPLQRYTPQARARVVSFVAQRLSYLPSFTVREFLALSAPKHSNRTVDPQLSEILTIAVPAPILDRKLPTLSGGELQRVVVGAALVQEAKILLLDEPTNHLDPRAAEELQQLLITLRLTGRYTTIFVSHDIGFALRCSDRIGIMKHGSLTWLGEAHSDRFLPSLEGAFEVRFSIVRHPSDGGMVPLPQRLP